MVKTKIDNWDGESGEYIITHEDAVFIREALKQYKKRVEKDPFFAEQDLGTIKRLRKIFRVASITYYGD